MPISRIFESIQKHNDGFPALPAAYAAFAYEEHSVGCICDVEERPIFGKVSANLL